MPTSCACRRTTSSWRPTARGTVGMFEDRGYRVTTVDISEFQKLEGCVTCLSVRIRVPVG